MNSLKVFFSTICTFLIGEFDLLLKVLCIVMLIDYITGLCKAIYLKKVNSLIGIKGLIKKIGYIIMIILATLADYLVNGDTLVLRTLVIYFFIANESISILENWALMNLPFPKKLYEVFDKLKDNNK